MSIEFSLKDLLYCLIEFDVGVYIMNVSIFVLVLRFVYIVVC